MICSRTLTSKTVPRNSSNPKAAGTRAWACRTARTGEEWVLRLINEQDVLVQPGFFYDFESEAFLILSLLTERDTSAEGAKRTILALNQP